MTRISDNHLNMVILHMLLINHLRFGIVKLLIRGFNLFLILYLTTMMDHVHSLVEYNLI